MGKSIRNLSTVSAGRASIWRRTRFQVHAVDATGAIVVARKLTRRPARPFLRRTGAVRGGDGGVRLGAPLGTGADRTRARGSIVAPRAYVKPYVRRNKNDPADAAATSARRWVVLASGSVPVRSIDNQADLMRHRAREACSPASARRRSTCFARPSGRDRPHRRRRARTSAYGLKRMAADGFNENGEIVVPDCVRGALRSLVGQIDTRWMQAIGSIDRELAAAVKVDETAKRVDAPIPGVGPVTASAIGGHDPGRQRSSPAGVSSAAFLGLTPRQNSTGGKNARLRAHHQDGRYRYLHASFWWWLSLRDAAPSPRPQRRLASMGERDARAARRSNTSSI